MNDCSALTNLWSVSKTEPDLATGPEELSRHGLQWQNSSKPLTVHELISDPEMNTIEEYDWWYRCHFMADESEAHSKVFLKFNGLATIAEVWLNGVAILQSENMFIRHSVEITDLLQKENQLHICFRSLSAFLKIKRPRPKWKTKLVSNQQLRWIRTTLLGRIPGWTPAVISVGPWQDVYLETLTDIVLRSYHITPKINANLQSLHAEFTIQAINEKLNIEQATLSIGELVVNLEISRAENTTLVMLGEADISNLSLWWPHTHGEPVLHSCVLTLVTSAGEKKLDLGCRGFKQTGLIKEKEIVGLEVNGVRVFSRGACWTISDIRNLSGDQEKLERDLNLAKDAGINMLRVGGTMVYESDSFYQLCDKLGIMIWQDFMFANMDYPVDDESFRNNIIAEVEGQITRLSSHACISVYCGNSEIQQQSSMLGLDKEKWSNSFFDIELGKACNDLHPGIPYFPSTPCDGVLPFHTNQGLSHYYGVGAYKRDLKDVVFADVKFTPETLGFSHIPEVDILDSLFNGDRPVMHDPRWKQGVPRDTGAGWDFEDIRDYYLEILFDVDPVILRSQDVDRYMALSRVVTGELIYRVFAHWRSESSNCMGALIWFYKDMVPGAGWGLIDSTSNPKAVYYAVKHAFVSLGIFIEDKGLNGLSLHIINEHASKHDLICELETFGNCSNRLLKVSKDLTLESRENITLGVDEIVGYFSDLGYVYKFGALQHQVIVARILNKETGALIDEDCFFPASCKLNSIKECDLEYTVNRNDNGYLDLHLTSSQFLQYVHLVFRNHEVDDNYFHLVPGSTRTIRLIEKGGDMNQPIKGNLEALNLIDTIRIQE